MKNKIGIIGQGFVGTAVREGLKPFFDIETYDIAKDILMEEIEHESWFLELLYGRPSGHMRRKFSGERPHTQKHSRALG